MVSIPNHQLLERELHVEKYLYPAWVPALRRKIQRGDILQRTNIN
jgi:hypothetical protein